MLLFFFSSLGETEKPCGLRHNANIHLLGLKTVLIQLESASPFFLEDKIITLKSVPASSAVERNSWNELSSVTDCRFNLPQS